MGGVPTRWLNFHVPYRCRHAGACCSSNWPIPLERERVPAITGLRTSGDWLVPAPDAPAEFAGLLARTRAGHCVFHQGGGHGCEIHAALGHPALPAACQHFPRRCLIDRRGVSVTLSHYCPTAAGLLFAHRGPVAIVHGPPAVPHGEPEGLDAREALPPSLTPRVLMDDEGYDAWEAHLVARLTADTGHTPEERLALAEADVQILSIWRPGSRTLVQAIGDLPAAPPSRAAADVWAPFSPVVLRFLAAHAFAAWSAYQQTSLAASVRRLDRVLQRLRRAANPDRAPLDTGRLTAAIRQVDLHLRHVSTERPEPNDRPRFS